MNYIKEVKAILIFIGIVFLFSLFVYLVSRFDPEYEFFKYLIVYIVITGVLTVLRKVIKNKIFNKVVNIFSFPAGLFLVLGILTLPYLKLIVNTFVYLSYVLGIPFVLFKLLKYYDLVKSPELITYLTWTIAVFTAILFNFQLRSVINYISPSYSDSSEKIAEDKNISDYLLSENNIRFIIYSVYVIVIIYTNIIAFQVDVDASESNYNKAILQSFVTFIAFERALSSLKTLKFKPSDLLKKIRESISNKIHSMKNN
jgi:hypothetical protein